MITLFQILGDPVTLVHLVGLYLVVAAIISFMLYEFFSFLRVLIRLWRDKSGRNHRPVSGQD